MEINKKQIELIRLTPSEGCYLTKKHRADDEEIVFSKEILTTDTNAEEIWIDITEEEAKILQPSYFTINN